MAKSSNLWESFLNYIAKNIDCYPQINPKFHNSNKLPNLFLSTPSFYRRKKQSEKKKKHKRKNRAEFIIASHLFRKKQYKSMKKNRLLRCVALFENVKPTHMKHTSWCSGCCIMFYSATQKDSIKTLSQSKIRSSLLAFSCSTIINLLR